MKKYKIAAFVAALTVCLSLTLPVFAAITPTLTLSATGQNTTQINVTGDAYATVQLYYYPSGATVPSAITNLGSTDASGNFFTVINQSSYGIASGVTAYVVVNGMQSANQSWPGNNSSLSLSQTSVSLLTGQSATVSVTNGTGMYISANSNSTVASGFFNNNQLTINAVNPGSDTITVCSTNAGCANIYVSVSGSSSGSTGLTLSQTSVSLQIGQSQNISITNANGIYISSNSNASVAGAAINNNNQVTITANNNGSTTVTMCSANAGCANIYVTVTGSSSGSNLYLSQTNLSLTVGQSTLISVTNGSGIYISAISNSSVAGAVVNNSSQITITANGIGTDTITVCNNSAVCANIYVTVTNSSSTSGSNLYLGQTNLSLTAGQSSVVSISNGSGVYISSNSNSSVAGAVVNSNSQLTVTGNNYGTATITVCSANNGCSSLYVTVQNTTSGSNLYLSQTNLSLTAGQSAVVSISNGSGVYISSNSNSSVAGAVVNSNSQLTVTGNNYGTATITVCSANNGCANLYISVQNTTVNQNPAGWYNGQGNYNRTKTINLRAGQSILETGFGNIKGYVLTSHTNSAVAAASIFKNKISIQGLSGGSDTITFCSPVYNAGCLVLSVNVDGATSVNPTSVTLNGYAQKSYITIYGSGPFYVSSNSNANAVSASVSNNMLTLTALNSGSATVTVCQSNASCASVYVSAQVPVRVRKPLPVTYRYGIMYR